MSAQVAPTTVLLAEDDANDVRLISRMLTPIQPNMRLQVVSNGEEALQYLKGEGRFSDRIRYPAPGMVLLDIGLPRMSGLQVLRRIREHPRLRGTIVVMLTGSESEEDLRAAYDLHVNSFLRKTPLLAMPDVSRAVLSYWLQLNLPPPGLS